MRPDSAEEKDDLELGMERPSSHNINPNNAFHPYGAQGAPKVNADVGLRNNGLPHVQWTFHTVNGKSIDRAGHDFGERSQEQPMKMESNKAFHHYAPQVARR